MTDRDHRTWFGFLERLAVLSREYSIEDLRWLKKEAVGRYPSAIPMIDACLSLAASDNRALRSEPVSDEKPPKSGQADVRLNSPLSAALLNAERFPANSDLVAFARSILPTFPELRFDKMGRGRIVDTIIAHMQKAAPETRGSFERALLQSGHANSDDVTNPKGARSSFLSDWERVIKGT